MGMVLYQNVQRNVMPRYGNAKKMPPQTTMKFFLVLKNYVSLQVSLYQIDPGHQYETKIQAITEIKIFDSVNKNIFIL